MGYQNLIIKEYQEQRMREEVDRDILGLKEKIIKMKDRQLNEKDRRIEYLTQRLGEAEQKIQQLEKMLGDKKQGRTEVKDEKAEMEMVAPEVPSSKQIVQKRIEREWIFQKQVINLSIVSNCNRNTQEGNQCESAQEKVIETPKPNSVQKGKSSPTTRDTEKDSKLPAFQSLPLQPLAPTFIQAELSPNINHPSLSFGYLCPALPTPLQAYFIPSLPQ